MHSQDGPSIPPWGMAGPEHPAPAGAGSGDRPRGTGAPRLVGVSVSGLDAVLLVGGLLIWTALFVLFFAQR